MLKFNKFNVKNTETGVSTKIWYSLDNRYDKKKCVTLYAKEYDNQLYTLFPEKYVNNTDTMTDYFEKGRVTLFEGDVHYADARIRAELNIKQDEEKRQKKLKRLGLA
jgi:hypothetical protein